MNHLLIYSVFVTCLMLIGIGLNLNKDNETDKKKTSDGARTFTLISRILIAVWGVSAIMTEFQQ